MAKPNTHTWQIPTCLVLHTSMGQMVSHPNKFFHCLIGVLLQRYHSRNETSVVKIIFQNTDDIDAIHVQARGKCAPEGPGVEPHAHSLQSACQVG